MLVYEYICIYVCTVVYILDVFQEIYRYDDTYIIIHVHFDSLWIGGVGGTGPKGILLSIGKPIGIKIRLLYVSYQINNSSFPAGLLHMLFSSATFGNGRIAETNACDPHPLLLLRPFPGTQKGAVAEPAKPPAPREPTEKPASARGSGKLLQMCLCF